MTSTTKEAGLSSMDVKRPATKQGSESGIARILGSGTAGILELSLFHPVDTVAKRLMSNTGKIFLPSNAFSENSKRLSQVLFKNAADASATRKFISLFPGVGYAAGYKVMQRLYKFGGQPVVRDFLEQRHGSDFRRAFGDKNGKTLIHATAGSFIGIGEIVLLPLDVLKIRRQINPDAFKGHGLFKIISNERFALYRGAGWTAARNAPGSFALFGGSAMVKEHIFGLADYNSATFFQNFCASIGGAAASITVAAPLDVIKTRVQSRSFESPKSGVAILRDLVRTEGVLSLFKGLTPKLVVVGPKLVFSFTCAQMLIPKFDSLFKKQ